MYARWRHAQSYKRADHKQPKATKSESEAPGNSDESLQVQQCLGAALPRSELKSTVRSTGGDKTSKKEGGRKKRKDTHTHKRRRRRKIKIKKIKK